MSCRRVGWGPAAGTKWDMHWFAESLDPDVLPWVYEVRPGQKAMSGATSNTVELLAIAALIDLRYEQQSTPQSSWYNVCMSGHSDNKGTSYIVAKLYTSAMPGAAHRCGVGTAR